MQYLVTGGEGFIGSNILKNITGESYDLKSGLDILDSKNLKEKAQNFDSIFHCAAKISVPESFQIPDEYFKNNVDGVRSVSDVAKELNKKIIFSSSAAVYGDSVDIVSENFSLNPKSPYAENKIDGEKILKESGLPHIVLRYFNVYGPGQSPEYAGVITFFILNALQNKDLVIFGDGEQVRDFIFIDDIVEANIKAMNYGNSEFDIFNIASGKKIKIKELAQIIIRLTNSNSKIIFAEPREGDIFFSQADISKAKNILGWKAKTDLEEGLKKTIEFYRYNLKNK